ncbi:uncharacterized [Tachysurus ichikawai]
MKEQSGLKLRRLRRGFHFIAVTFSDLLDDGGVCDGATQSSPHVNPEHLFIHLLEKAALPSEAIVATRSVLTT